MTKSIETADGSLEVEPDSTDIEALKRARIAEFTADLHICGPSKYIPVPRELLEYDSRVA
jgi:hypothetical protein